MIHTKCAIDLHGSGNTSRDAVLRDDPGCAAVGDNPVCAAVGDNPVCAAVGNTPVHGAQGILGQYI